MTSDSSSGQGLRNLVIGLHSVNGGFHEIVGLYHRGGYRIFERGSNLGLHAKKKRGVHRWV